VRSKREPVATSQSIGTAAFAWNSDLPRFQNQTIPRYTLSASGLSSNLRKVIAAQQLSLIRRPDAPIFMRNAR
jgi:hypothetical protein